MDCIEDGLLFKLLVAKADGKHEPLFRFGNFSKIPFKVN